MRIKEMINKEPKLEVKIVVGNTDSDVKTLNEALEMAQPGTTIKLNEGHYHVCAKIKTPGLKIEPRKKDTVVYLLCEEGACITLDLKPGETCIISSMIIAHFGSNIANKFNEQIKDTDLKGANPKFLKQFDCNKDMDCAVLVLGGSLIMRNCLVSLKSLPENIKSSIPSFVAMPGSRVNLIKTEFRGNEAINTAGAIMLNADVLMSDCMFNNFRAGGLYVNGHSETSIKISDSTFNRCGVTAIYSQGEDCKPLFLRINIENVDGPGIKIYKANRAKVKGCNISKCQIGIEVICGDPFIILNKIYKNYEHGILTVAKKGLRCDALIKFNEIYKNKDNGIVCSGENNYTRIIRNVKIADNRRAGVKAIDKAHLSIIDNIIKCNFGQGILLVEGTSAHIEENEVFLNYKANIAFGGERSADTVILK